uniref:Uncharacterized protein n=1 Tax=Fagus sylvatica TaxID=28930 RepID=A0A2N9HVS9_FAGSY
MEESGSDPKFICIHGDLDLKIIDGRHLPNMDLVAQHFRRCFTACDIINPCHTSTESDACGHHHRKIIPAIRTVPMANIWAESPLHQCISPLHQCIFFPCNNIVVI